MIEFTPWKFFSAFRDRAATRNFLLDTARTTKAKHNAGIKSPPKTGVKHSSLPNRSSRPGEYPANQSGRLARSLRTRVTQDMATEGATIYYAYWLAYGSKKMEPRRMSREALTEALPETRARAKPFVRWKRA